jgi:hypothetical protein
MQGKNMEREKLESLIIDYIDNKLAAADRRIVEQELVENQEAYKMYEELKEVINAMERSAQLSPPARLKSEFEKMLQLELKGSGEGRSVVFRPTLYRAAAAIALVVLSGAFGFWISRTYSENQRLAEVERQMELTRMQLAETKQTMMNMLDNDQSASQRIRGINVAMDFTSADAEIVHALFTTMNSDPNTNVRLAALGALGKFQDDPLVRKGLLEALDKQRDPMVQIALIQLLVQMKQKNVVDDLKKIVEDPRSIKAVKDEAYSGILKLS